MPRVLDHDAKIRLQDAVDFTTQNPTEKAVVLSRIFHVNALTLRSWKRRQRQQATPRQHGSHNKVLSESQNEAIRRYIQRSYEAGYGATKAMVFEAIAELKRAEILPKPAPSKG